MSELLKNLNKEQIQAVTHATGPLLIVAGAGTGKTSVITTKIAWLIEEKRAEPNEILALTFTDKASTEMEERVDTLVPYGMFDIWISTFHSFCDRILENHALDIGLGNNYRLINTTESWLLIRKNLHVFDLDYYTPKGNPTQFIHALISLFSRLKDEHITPEEYLDYAEGLVADTDTTMSGKGKPGARGAQSADREADSADNSSALEAKRIKETAHAYFQYQQLLLDNSFLDFGDLIFYMNKVFVQRPNILKEYQEQFKYILVDEFQDTNLGQYKLIKHLSKSAQITVVGDDDQSIYKFRGASVSNILNFKSDFPDAAEIVLTQNYRSGQKILDCAYKFIQHNNPDRLEEKLNISKKLVAHKTAPGTIHYIAAVSQDEEVIKTLEEIKTLIKNPNITYSDIAILVRAHSSAESFIRALEQEDIPYIYVANSGLYQQPIIMDILAFARVLFDRNDAPSLTRVLLMPTLRIPPEDSIIINTWAQKNAQTLFETLKSIRQITALSERTKASVEKLVALISLMTKSAPKADAARYISEIINQTNYRTYLIDLEKKDPQSVLAHVSSLNQLFKKITEFQRIYKDNSLGGFIEHIALEREAGDMGALNQNIEEQGPEAIRIMTIHASKGLEFSYVFIPHMVALRFPTTRRSESITIPDDLLKEREILPTGDALEEERRLFYVALTRAKQGVFVSGALNYGGKRAKKPSRFLVESKIIDPGALHSPKQENVSLQTLLPKTPDKKKEAQKFTYPIPNKFSYSQINTFKKCPLQYKYQFVLKIPQDKGRASFSFGTTMHNTLLQFFKRIQNQAATEQPTLFGKNESPANEKSASINITLDDLYKIYDEQWIGEWYPSKESKEQHYKAGKKILKEFFERHKDNWPIPSHLEKPFSINLDGNIVKGRIDRIDTVGEKDGKPQVEIIDYKTTKFKDKLDKNDKIQLLIYQIALESLNLKPVKLKYYYLHESKQDTTEFIGTEKEIEKTKSELVETMEEIKESTFPANPSAFNCGYCDFKNICPFSKA